MAAEIALYCVMAGSAVGSAGAFGAHVAAERALDRMRAAGENLKRAFHHDPAKPDPDAALLAKLDDVP